MKDSRSFFEKLTGAVRVDTDMDSPHAPTTPPSRIPQTNTVNTWMENEPEEGELAVDVYQTPVEIIIKTMVAGVRPEDLEISITRDMVTIRGKREAERTVREEDYYHQELYWGTFSRTVMLPAEIDVEESDAVEKHGLLIIRMPKIDKHKQTRLKVKG